MTSSRVRLDGSWATTLLALAIALSLLAVVAPSAHAGRRVLSGSMTLAGGATYSTTAGVALTSVVRGATQMRVQNAGGAWTAWEAYTATRSWTLTAGDGAKTVNAQYRVSAGKALTLSATITLDTTAPVTTATSTVPAPFVDVELAPADAVSGVAATMYRLDGGAWRSGTSMILCAGHKRASLRAGAHTVEFYSVDAAGNVEAVQSLIVKL